MTRRTAERASVSVELAILLPGFVLLILLAIIAGRQVIAQGAIELAAFEASRAASISRTPGTALANGERVARDTLARQGLQCAGGPTVTVDVSQFARPVGQSATIFVEVVCNVSLVDVAPPGVSNQRRLVARFSSPLDRYRSRG